MFKQLISVIILIIVLTSCKNEKTNKEYFIISEHGFFGDSLNYKRRTPPPPPPPQELKWYSNVVFIMDSTNMVYVYQTECDGNINETGSYDNSCFQRVHEKIYDFNIDKIIDEFDYPNYIGLRPEHLISFDSRNFKSFIQLNSDIFQLDTNTKAHRVIFYVASNKDTIKNEAFYNLFEFLTKKQGDRRKIVGIVRKTTEEENKVIYYKKKRIDYLPEELKWSTDFITGKFRPFTKQYDSIEQMTNYIIKARETFKKNSLVRIPML